MGFGGAAGRLVELGERQRRAQFEAARALLFCDGDGGPEGFFAQAPGWRDHASAEFRRAPGAVRRRRRDDRSARTSPALRRGSRERDRHRLRALRLPRAQSSRARRRAGCSARAEVRRRGACPRAPRRARHFRRSPSPRERPRRLATSAGHAHARVGRVRTAFSAARARSPRISSNMAAYAFPIVRACRYARRSRSAPSRVVDEGNRALDVRPAATT